MHECAYSYFCKEVIDALADRVDELQRNANRNDLSLFEHGRSHAYWEVISILEDRAVTMQIDLPKLGLKYAADDLLNPDGRERGINSRPNA